MAIKITKLDEIANLYKKKDFIYKDLHLDFTKNSNYSTTLEQAVPGNDIKVDYDESAIRNSIKNLFNTKPGQRFLFPKYGLDLYQYLFEPVSEDIGQIIGENISYAITTFEPRVTLLQCEVVAVPDDNLYDITIIINIPIFDTVASLNTILDTKSQTFIFLENSRNI